MTPSDRIFVALDVAEVTAARDLAQGLRGLIGGVKLGKEFFTANGPEGVREITASGLPVFLDLKFHDIPATVAGAVRAALPLAPAMLTLHAAGGAAMMRAAVEAAGTGGTGAARPKLLAVTVLTSLGEPDLEAIGVAGPAEAQVERLARLAKDCGLDGAVCSPREAKALRRALGPDFTLVVPGIRPAWAGADDQKRIMTPADAVAAGADYLVIGRPVTGADDPAAACRRIAADLG